MAVPMRHPRSHAMLLVLACAALCAPLAESQSASTTAPGPTSPIFSLADCPNPISSTTDCDCSQCTLYGSVFLKDKCCSRKGVPATILAFEQADAWVPRLNEFNACTGARLSLTYNGPDGLGDEDQMEDDLQDDIGVEDTTENSAIITKPGAGIYDGYITQAPWLPAIQHGLENLSPWIAESGTEIRWQDVNPTSRASVSFNNSVRALPLDVDYVAMGWRQDVFENWNITSPPETLEELIQLSEFFNGKDHNGDGEPDWGFCMSAQSNYFYSFVAPILQQSTRECRAPLQCDGPITGQNMFFDPTSFDPLIDNPGFKYATYLYGRLLASSNCPEQLLNSTQSKYGIRKCDRRIAFQTGKCAGVISMPNTLTNMLRFIPRRFDANGTLLWEPKTKSGEHYGRRARFPGSSLVWDRASNTLRSCDSTLCPKAISHSKKPGVLVNFAPYFAEGGEAYSIRASTAEKKKELLWDLFAWFSTLPSEILPLTGQYRYSQLTQEYVNHLVSVAKFPKEMAEDLLAVLTFYFKDDIHQGGNAVKDLLVLGFSSYMRAVEESVQNAFLLKPELLYERDQTLYRQAFDQNFGDFLEHMRNNLERVTVEHGGHLAQLLRWRASLNMQYQSPRQICENLKENATKYSFCDQFAPSVQSNNDERNRRIIIGVIVGLVVAVLLLIIAVFRFNQVRRNNRDKHYYAQIQDLKKMIHEEFVHKYGDDSNPLEALRIRPAEIALGNELGRGFFGIVNIGLLQRESGQEPTWVAVKQLTNEVDPDTIEAFLFEAHLQARMMAHENILKLIAVQIDTQPMMIITELMRGGNLLSYLRRFSASGASHSINKGDLIKVLIKIADAMAFLESNKVVHRDLAARNVLVGTHITDVRLSDFGMSRRLQSKNYYKKISDDKIPVKWMALEAIQFKIYTHASDVWSFGVLGWEVFSLGECPWSTFSNLETVLAIANGKRLPCPSFCPNELYDLFMRCWSIDAAARPGFKPILDELVDLSARLDGLEPQPIALPKLSRSSVTSGNSVSSSGLLASNPGEGMPESAGLVSGGSSVLWSQGRGIFDAEDSGSSWAIERGILDLQRQMADELQNQELRRQSDAQPRKGTGRSVSPTKKDSTYSGVSLPPGFRPTPSFAATPLHPIINSGGSEGLPAKSNVGSITSADYIHTAALVQAIRNSTAAQQQQQQQQQQPQAPSPQHVDSRGYSSFAPVNVPVTSYGRMIKPPSGSHQAATMTSYNSGSSRSGSTTPTSAAPQSGSTPQPAEGLPGSASSLSAAWPVPPKSVPTAAALFSREDASSSLGNDVQLDEALGMEDGDVGGNEFGLGNSFEEEFAEKELPEEAAIGDYIQSKLAAQTGQASRTPSAPSGPLLASYQPLVQAPPPVSASMSLSGALQSSKVGSDSSISSIGSASSKQGSATSLSFPFQSMQSRSLASSPSMQMMMGASGSGSGSQGALQPAKPAQATRSAPLSASPLRRSYDVTAPPAEPSGVAGRSFSPAMAILEESRPRSPTKTALSQSDPARASAPMPASILLRDIEAGSKGSSSSSSVLSQESIPNISRFDNDPTNRRNLVANLSSL